ncbi:MAG TPA: hypothetical protein VLE21_05715 [Candidatus Nitrosocosmicus sp.]|nr:hypothetical protein [Candidatus Nitrosocosmicus sp.]
MKCHICNHPIVASKLKVQRLDNKKDIFYDIVFDICDYCNGPIIGVRRYDRQDPTTFYDENPPEISEDKMEFYTKDNKTEDSKF